MGHTHTTKHTHHHTHTYTPPHTHTRTHTRAHFDIFVLLPRLRPLYWSLGTCVRGAEDTMPPPDMSLCRVLQSLWFVCLAFHALSNLLWVCLSNRFPFPVHSTTLLSIFIFFSYFVCVCPTFCAQVGELTSVLVSVSHSCDGKDEVWVIFLQSFFLFSKENFNFTTLNRVYL